ncbi:hypothetical protein GCU56_04125 [Geodermatophilus sabuli]|uniref:PQQ-like domain-containing protein n=1 Tax=Geodermatophilus sabuli TaxID=1564158 RepID=A0A7K3VWN6_9ACTN|nr:hypothetical protein [Geodermatophilus sabuli]NEK57059.1 hypothetical protein [Geodermatophilus sabuli]
MTRARRAAATLAVALLVTGCTGADGDEPDGRETGDALLGTLDLDAAVGADVTLADLAPGPDGAPVALLTALDARQSWLVRITHGDGGPAADVRTIPPVPRDSGLAVAGDGTVLVVGDDLLAVPPDGEGPTAVPLPLGGPPSAVALDGRTLYLARGTALAAVDAATGAVRTTATAAAPVTHLALDPTGGLAALVNGGRKGGGTGAVLARYDTALRPVGEPVPLVPERGSSATALEVTADGVAVATVHLGEARSVGRLVTVADGAVQLSVDLDGAGDSALGLVVDPDGRSATVAVADLQFPAELVTVDLGSGDRIGAVKLCGGTGVFGAVAGSADGPTLVTGACVDEDGPQTTAFLVG